MIPVECGGTLLIITSRRTTKLFYYVEHSIPMANLVEYLKSVVSDADLFNSYHKWREWYKFDNNNGRQELPAWVRLEENYNMYSSDICDKDIQHTSTAKLLCVIYDNHMKFLKHMEITLEKPELQFTHWPNLERQGWSLPA